MLYALCVLRAIWGSSEGIVSRVGAVLPGCSVFFSAAWLTQLVIQWVLGVILPRVQRPQRELDYCNVMTRLRMSGDVPHNHGVLGIALLRGAVYCVGECMNDRVTTAKLRRGVKFPPPRLYASDECA
jgi:hypothetical protein